MEKTKNKTGKYIRNFILYILVILLTFYIVLKDQSITDVLKVFINIDHKYIIIAILSMCLYFACESINIGRILKTLGEKTHFFRNVKYTLIGFFFSAVTPAASGGQPMQVYYMHKDKISVGNATLTLLINLISIQIVTISIALVSLIFNYMYLTDVMRWLFAIGIILNGSALTLLLIGVFSKRTTKWLIRFVLKILKFFKVKNLEEKEEKLLKELKKYQVGARYIKLNKIVMIKTILTTYVQFLLFYSISYWVYKALGLSGYNIMQILSIQSVLYGSTSAIPSPGAVGVSEGGFIEIYKVIYSEEMIKGAMLLNRGVNFYLFVIISSIIVMIYTIRDKKEEKLKIEKKIKKQENLTENENTEKNKKEE